MSDKMKSLLSGARGLLTGPVGSDGDGKLLMPSEQEQGNRVGRFFVCAASVIAALMAIFILVLHLRYRVFTDEALYLRVGFAIFGILLAVWVWGLIRFPGHSGILTVLAIALALRCYYVIEVQPIPISDFWLLHRVAQKVNVGDLSWEVTEDYFRSWSYQLPFVYYQALVLKVVPSEWGIKALNVAYEVGIVLFVYLIACEFTSRRVALIPALLYAVYPASIHMVAVLTNQHISTFFMMLGVWLMLSKRRVPWMFVAGVCLAVGNLMRPEAVVFLATLACCGVVAAIRFPKKYLPRLIAGVLAVIAGYAAVSGGVKASLEAAGLAPYGVRNNRPEWKFVVGLDTSGLGYYSADNRYILLMEDEEERKAEVIRVITESITGCDDLKGFFLRKLDYMWGSNEAFHWSTDHLRDAPYYETKVVPVVYTMTVIEKAIYLLVWAAAPFAAFDLCKKRREKSGVLLFCLVALCAAFCVFVLIEVQVRYRYFIMPILFVMTAIPAERLLAWRPKFLRRVQQKKNEQSQ